MHILRQPRSVYDLSEVSKLKAHLRIDGDYSDLELHDMAAAVAQELEDSAEIALTFQMITLSLDRWPEGLELRLPVGPVISDHPIFAVLADGEAVQAELLQGLRPRLVLDPQTLRAVQGKPVEITYQAGWGPSPDQLPPDISHAIRDQVAALYDGRGATPHEGKAHTATGTAGLCYAMLRVTGRYRGVRA